MNAISSVDAQYAGLFASANAKFKKIYLFYINIRKSRVWVIVFSYAEDGE